MSDHRTPRQLVDACPGSTLRERLYIHVQCADGEAKLSIEPQIEPARNCGLSLRA